MSALSIRIVLDEPAIEALGRPVVGSGGFQSLLRQLQSKLGQDGVLVLTPYEVGTISRYVNDYGNGGFQGRLDFVLRELTSLANALRPIAA